MTQFKNEQAAVSWFQKMCREKGAFCQKLQLRFTVGFPDFVVVYDGHTAFYEFKRPGGAVDKLQRVTLRRICEAGGYGAVVTMHSPSLAFVTHAETGMELRVIPNHPLLWLAPPSLEVLR